MSELDKIIDIAVTSGKELISLEASPEEREELAAALREKKKRDVVREIRNEYKQELIQKINAENEQEANRQRIKDLKKLMGEGFFLAFIVGLAVNQMTEIITYVKGGDNFNRTLILTIGLVAICIVAYMYIFFENAIALLKEKK